MKIITLALIPFLLMVSNIDRSDNVYDFELVTIEGEKITLEKYSDNLLLIVNTASECGFTPQYKDLQKLHDTYKDKGFTVLGFPANNFGGQEPGSDEEILEFCEMNYGVNFPLFSKVDVVGDDAHPLFKYLTSQENPGVNGEVSWNFEKFLVDGNGKLIKRFDSRATPMDTELISEIEKAL